MWWLIPIAIGLVACGSNDSEENNTKNEENDVDASSGAGGPSEDASSTSFDAGSSSPDASPVDSMVPDSATAMISPDYGEDVFIERVNVGYEGDEADSSSNMPMLSSDGRFVAYRSWAANLSGGDTNGVEDIFVRDRLAGRTERVNVSSQGQQDNQGVGMSGPGRPFMSADGRYVGFVSQGTNLVENDNNDQNDVFVRDTLGNSTELMSVRPNGQQFDADSRYPALSADGRYVAFHGANSILGPPSFNFSRHVTWKVDPFAMSA